MPMNARLAILVRMEGPAATLRVATAASVPPGLREKTVPKVT